MRIAAILALGLVVVVIGIEVRRFAAEGSRTHEALTAVERKLEAARGEAASLEENIRYFTKPENLEKEMRARFNYRSAGEKLMILVPKEASTSVASSVPDAAD